MRLLASSRPFGAALAAGALALLVSACGSASGSSSQVASLGGSEDGAESSETSAPVDTQEAWLAFAQCMRDNGVEMDDPTFDADGNVQGGFGPGSGIDMQDEAARTALDACRDLMQDIGPGGGRPGGGDFDATATQDAFNEFTDCLRDEGLDVDDIEFGVGPGGGTPGEPPADAGGEAPAEGQAPPDGFQGGPPPSGGAPEGGPGGEGFDPTDRIIEQLELDEDDPAVAAALEVCQPLLDGAFTPPASATEES